MMMMIYPWEWLWFICRRFVTLLVCVVRPQLEREYLTYQPPAFIQSILQRKFQTGTYQQAINKVVVDKKKLLLYFIHSQAQADIKKLHACCEEEVGEECAYYVILVDDYLGWLLACKLQVFSVPSTLLIAPGNVGPRILERYMNKLHMPLSSGSTVSSPSETSTTTRTTPMTLIEEQERAFERSMQMDLLRQRQKQSVKLRQEKYAKLLEDYVVQQSEGEDVYRLAIQMPDGVRLNRFAKASAPTTLLFAIVRGELEDSNNNSKIRIKSVDPALSFHEEGEDGEEKDEKTLSSSGLYRMQKLFVEVDSN